MVDDHPMMRAGLRQVLEQQPGLTVAGEFSTGQEALAAIGNLAPDLVIMDVHLPDRSGLEISRQLLADGSPLKIIVLSADSDRALVDEALQIGVCGYLLKNSAADELARALRLVMEGRLYLCPELASSVLGDYRKALTARKSAAEPALTDREKQVLRLLAEGLQNKEIASHLNVSPKSVEKSRARLMDKLGYRSVAELTRYALRERIISS